jgi:hypothetical protein
MRHVFFYLEKRIEDLIRKGIFIYFVWFFFKVASIIITFIGGGEILPFLLLSFISVKFSIFLPSMPFTPLSEGQFLNFWTLKLIYFNFLL